MERCEGVLRDDRWLYWYSAERIDAVVKSVMAVVVVDNE